MTAATFVPMEPGLRRRLASAAKRRTAAEAERNRLILEASEAGASLREIAEVVGLSHVAVLKIVRRQSEP